MLDPGSLGLVQRFEELRDLASNHPVLAGSLVGELISSEVEIRSGRAASFSDAVGRQARARRSLFDLAADRGIALSAMGTHPWAPWQEQHIIDTPHYHRVEDGLKYVAWRNNTFSMHVHVGINGADRAVAVCDQLREILPVLLALSCNSPYLDGRLSGLHSVRSQIFTRGFPRCGVPDAYGNWDNFAQYVEFLIRAGSLVENTQLWWSVRPHLSFGTVEIRICDAQSNGHESFALAALLYACVVQAALDYDAGRRVPEIGRTLIEENLWRAIRYGLEGNLIDLPNPVEVATCTAVERVIEWTAPARDRLGLEGWLGPVDVALRQGNGAQRQIERHNSGCSMREVLAESVEETRATYVPSRAEKLEGPLG